MSFDTVIRFIQMGGYGAYVWSAYGIAFFALSFHFIYARRQFQKVQQAVSMGKNPMHHPKGARTVVIKELP